MALSNHDQMQIRQYLLGKLSLEEEQKIEERLVVEDELFDEFEISKDEVIEEYCAGELSQSERLYLEQNLLATAEGRERHVFALTMECFQRPPGVGSPVEDPKRVAEPQRQPLEDPRPLPLRTEQPLSLHERQRPRATPWFMQPRTLALAASVVIVALVGVLVLPKLFSRGGGEEFTGPLLASNITNRGVEGALPAKIKLAPKVATLKLPLSVPKGFPTGTKFQAKLDDRVSTKPVDVVDFKDDVVSVTIPADLLPRGEYSVELSATTPDGVAHPLPGAYFFNIE